MFDGQCTHEHPVSGHRCRRRSTIATLHAHDTGPEWLETCTQHQDHSRGTITVMDIRPYHRW